MDRATHSPAEINAKLTKDYTINAELRRDPDLLLVFRYVSPEIQVSILEKFDAAHEAIKHAPWEDYVAIHAFPSRINSAETMGQIGERNGLTYQFNTFPDGDFGPYKPKDGGISKETRHYLIVTGPDAP